MSSDMSREHGIENGTDTVDDCWNRIGVRGDRSCDRLEQHGHCRNCEVHAGAAARMMARPVPPEYREAWTRHFAAPETAARVAGEAALVFRVGQEWLALPARHTVLVAEHGKPHRLPHRHGNELHGIVNVKGRLYPCMSLAAMLHIAQQESAREQSGHAEAGHRVHARILVVQLGGTAFALPVQEVYGIHRYHEDELQPPPATLSRETARYFRGVLHIDGRATGCLDADLLGHQFAGVLK